MSTHIRYLTVTRGLPASGKTSWAKRQVQSRPEEAQCISRDDLRFMTFDKPFGTNRQESMITRLLHDSVRSLLSSKMDVYVHNTNLNVEDVVALHEIAREYYGQVQFRVQDFQVDVDECIRRDAARIANGQRGVGEGVIRKMSNRYLKGGSTLPQLPAEVYEHISPHDSPFAKYSDPDAKEFAWLVDIDGTIAHMTERSPFDWDRVGEDLPILPAIQQVNGLKELGYTIVLMSGRDEVCRSETEAWLTKHGIRYDHLFMSPNEDRRKDYVVKREMFERHVRGRFLIEGVIDDRTQVVRMWRQMGLYVCQVSYGNF